MAIKKKLNPTSIQTNKFIAESPEKRKKIRAQVEFRHDLLESQNGLITRTNLIDYKVLRNYQD